MSEEAARDFVSRVEDDENLAAELDALKADPLALLTRVRAEGFDVEPGEIRDAFLERHGAELNPEQLAALAAGIDDNGNLTLGEQIAVSFMPFIAGALTSAAAAAL
jgi:predicted ribosomally synthesized peptide with nif11-like leader